VNSGPNAPTPTDEAVVTAQLGRAPRGDWWVEARCGFGYPQVVATPPILDDDTPFPTLYWLSCPWLMAVVSTIESEGGVAYWAARLAADRELFDRLLRADEQYRARRAALVPAGPDPFGQVGIAGQRDPAATKCLHAHVATALAGIDDPVGAELLAALGHECPDGRCASLTCLREEDS
jgi:uncharacterized protein